jgi:hypothetical protein
MPVLPGALMQNRAVLEEAAMHQVCNVGVEGRQGLGAVPVRVSLQVRLKI